MKVIQQTSTQLTLKKIPWSAWLSSIIFFVVGVYTALTCGASSGISLSIGIILMIIGLLGIFSRISTCDFNTDTGQFTLKHQELLGTKRTQVLLSEIVAVEIKNDYDLNDSGYQVKIVLWSSKRVTLDPTEASTNRQGKQKTAELIRSFLRLPNLEIPPQPRVTIPLILNLLFNSKERQLDELAQPGNTEYEQAIVNCESEIYRYPMNIHAYRKLAHILALQRQLELAKAKLQQALLLLQQRGEYTIAREIKFRIKQLEQGNVYGRRDGHGSWDGDGSGNGGGHGHGHDHGGGHGHGHDHGGGHGH